MADQWYFARPYTEFGPFTAAQLQELAASGQLQPQDTVWMEGTEKRVAANKVKGLFSATRAVPPAAGPNGQTNGGVALPPGLPRFASSVPPTPCADSPPLPPPDAVQPTAAPIADASDDFELAEREPAPWAPAAANPPTEATEPEPAANARTVKAPEAKPKRVIGVKGGLLVSQDGEVVKFRKKCIRCGYLDTSLTTMKIRSGVSQVPFFCPKCKKTQPVAVQGVG
jgi:hypothetical protein